MTAHIADNMSGVRTVRRGGKGMAAYISLNGNRVEMR